MNDVERELRNRFARTEARLTGPDFAPAGAPSQLLRRTRRRQVSNVAIGICAAAAVVIASIAGGTALTRSSERRIPAEPEPFSPGAFGSAAAQPVSFEGLIADTDGALWSTTPGLTRFDPASGSFRTLTMAEDLAFDGVTDVAPSRKGGVWVLSPWYGPRYGGEQMVRRVDGEEILETSAPAPAYLSNIAEGPDGTVWASGGGGVFSWDGTSWLETPSEGGPAETGEIAVDTAGNVWVENLRYPGPEFFGISRFDGSAWTTWAADEVVLGRVWTIAPGPDGDVWVGGSGRVAHFVDGAWISYSSADLGLPANVMSIAIADGGMVWVGGEAIDGNPPTIARFDGTTWVPVVEGLEGDGGTEYTRVSATQQGIWATTNTGLFRLVGSRWERALPIRRPSDVMPPIAAAGADELWMGDWTAYGGVWRLQDDDWTHASESDGVPGGWLHDLAVSEDGTAWVAAKRGLSSFDGVTWERVASGEHTAIALGPDGEAWTASGNFEDWTVQPVGGTALPTLDALGTVSSLAVGAEDDVWAGSEGVWGLGGGLAHFDGEGWTRVEPIVDVEEPLVTDIQITPDGDVWVGIAIPTEDGMETPTGIVARYHDGTWTTFDEAQGIPLAAVNGDLELEATPDGQLLLATWDGLFTFRDGSWELLEGGRFTMLSVAPDGTVWLGGDGLFRIPAS